MKIWILCLPLLLLGCPKPTDRDSPSPAPITPPDTDLCGSMCKHIGPKAQGGLGCEEGDPVYDSDRSGPPDVPNMTCEEFCRMSQDRGSFINPRCVRLVKSCSEIETARKRKPASCS